MDCLPKRKQCDCYYHEKDQGEGIADPNTNPNPNLDESMLYPVCLLMWKNLRRLQVLILVLRIGLVFFLLSGLSRRRSLVPNRRSRANTVLVSGLDFAVFIAHVCSVLKLFFVAVGECGRNVADMGLRGTSMYCSKCLREAASEHERKEIFGEC